MDSGIIDNQLNLALDVPQSVRDKTLDLDVGYDAETNLWELIVKYHGDLRSIAEELQASIVELANGYAIITISEYCLHKVLIIGAIYFR